SHEFVHGESAENLHVFENIVRHLGLFLWRGLAVCRRKPEEQHGRHCNGFDDDSPGLEFHIAFLALPRIRERIVCAGGYSELPHRSASAISGAYPITLQLAGKNLAVSL